MPCSGHWIVLFRLPLSSDMFAKPDSGVVNLDPLRSLKGASLTVLLSASDTATICKFMELLLAPATMP